jgi:hypothetical protein
MLRIIMLSDFVLSVIKLSDIVLLFILVTVSKLSLFKTCHLAECLNAEHL